MRGCHRIPKMLLPYIDDALSDRNREGIEEHLKKCANCREELELLKRVGNLLAQKAKAERPKEYWQEFQDKLRYRLTPHYRFSPAKSFKIKPVLVACSIIFVFLASGILIREHNRMLSYRNQMLQLQVKLERLEREKEAQETQLAFLGKIAQSPRYQIVVLQEQNPVTGKGEPAIFYREIRESGYLGKAIYNLEENTF